MDGKMLNIAVPLLCIALMQFNCIQAASNILSIDTSRILCDGKPCGYATYAGSAMFKIQETHFKSNVHGALFKEGGSWTESISKFTDTANGAISGMSGIISGVGSVAGSVNEVIGSVGNIIKTVDEIKMNRQKMKMQQQQFEAEMATKTTELCKAICVLAWEPWGSCSAMCGGGRTTRVRQRYDAGVCKDYPCPHHLEESVDCNMDCPNAGWPTGKGNCKCKRNFNGECCEEEILCDYPGKPRSGSVSGEWPSPFGAVASYDCDDGFAMVGEDWRVCRNNNSWTGAVPKCDRVKCTKPYKPSDGLLLNNQDEYFYEENAYYRCDRGYDMAGPEALKCDSLGDPVGRFVGFPPICIPKDCGPSNWPLYGGYEGTEFTIDNSVNYYCEKGFRMMGPKTRTCLKSGSWSGADVECKLITCDPPFTPNNGDYERKKESYNYGETIRFECEAGHLLVGQKYSKCIEDPDSSSFGGGGKWDSMPPECTAAICEDPGTIENGLKEGSDFFYPHNVTYTCYAGHVMRGHQTIACKKTGVWSYDKPKCNACEIGFYKSDMSNQFKKCEACPEHSSTSSTGSTSIEQCVCDDGYDGIPGGSCSKIGCKKLSSPEHGSISKCENSYNSVCSVSCDSGYIMKKGTSKRNCGLQGTWDGTDAICEACQENTFKADSSSCYPCAENSHADGTANMEKDCVCNPGFEGPAGGPCTDINECEPNNGQGPCSDKCENTFGGYECSCTIPGQMIKPHDPHTCILDESCRNLTRDDAPENGGLVCHWFHQENSQQCDLRCNPGYDFPSERNNFETCGPTSEFEWSFEKEGAEKIEACMEEIFPDIRLAADSKYFTSKCDDLTEDEKDEIKEEFAKVLNNGNVCQKSDMQVCEVKDMEIICGHATSYMFGGMSYSMAQINVGFNVSAVKIEEKAVDCDKICKQLHVPESKCEKLCLPVYKRFLLASVKSSKKQMEEVFANKQKATFSAANRYFSPSPNSLSCGDVKVECGEGMVNEENVCVACAKGSYYDEPTNKCVKCRKGFYASKDRATKCELCPDGTISMKTGSSICAKCPNKRWGVFCRKTCNVINGVCDGKTGKPICSSGWEGPKCTKDIDGCVDHDCPKNKRCLDMRAPGTGYRCV